MNDNSKGKKKNSVKEDTKKNKKRNLNNTSNISKPEKKEKRENDSVSPGHNISKKIKENNETLPINSPKAYVNSLDVKTSIVNLEDKESNEFSQKQLYHLNQPLKLNFNYDSRYSQLANDNDILREENINLRRNYERERIKNLNLEEKFANYSNNSKLEKMKEKNLSLETELQELRSILNNKGNKSKEKIEIFIKICKKYIKKNRNLLNLITKLDSNIKISEGKELLLNEMFSTNEKFYNTVYNPKLIDTLVEGSIDHSKKTFLEESEDESFFTSQFSLVDIVQNLESQVKSLQAQNENLRKRRFNDKPLENEGEDIANLRINLNEIKRRYEEELQQNRNRIVFLEEENNKLYKSVKIYKDEAQENEFLKEKVSSLENDLSYKQSVIDYLEKLNNQQNNDQNIEESTNRNKYPEEPEEFYKDKSISAYEANQQNSNLPGNNQKHIQHYNNYQITSERSLNTFISPRSNNEQSSTNYGKEKKNDLIYSNEEYNNVNTEEMLQKNQIDESFAKKYLNSPSANYQSNVFKSNEIAAGLETNMVLNSPTSDINVSKASSLKHEIDNLDNEIRHLQGKLKYMIQNKKKE